MVSWRLFKIVLAVIVISALLIFFMSNSTPEAQSLAKPISFKFGIDNIFQLESVDFKVGYLLIIAFAMGMFIAILMGGLTAFSKGKELKMKKRTILELEGEIDELRDLLARERRDHPSPSAETEENRLPEDPEVS